MRVFLGGTCNGSEWREEIVPMLEIDYFNPVVEDWTEECMAEEIRERETCDFCLYTITPKMTGVYSIAEVIDDSNKRPNRTIFVALSTDGDDSFTSAQMKSLSAVAKMVKKNGGQVFDNLRDAANYMNGKIKTEQKYAGRHINFCIKEHMLLKEEAAGKPFEDLTREDFQDWVIPFMWEKASLHGGIDVYGEELSMKELEDFWGAMWRPHEESV